VNVARSQSTRPQFALAALLSIAVGFLLVREPKALEYLLAAAVACGIVYVAATRPTAAVTGAVFVLVLVPSYAIPVFDTSSVVLSLVAIGLAGRLWANGALPRPGLLDAAVFVFFLSLALPVVFGVRSSHEYFGLIVIWVGPYLAGRLFVAEPRQAVYLVRRARIASLLLVPFVIFEAVTGTNIFQNLTINPSGAATWTHVLARLGEHRVAASFGHPIALSMFLAAMVVICLGMAFQSGGRDGARLWLLSAAVLLIAQSFALSRTGWLVISAGLLLLALGARPGVALLRFTKNPATTRSAARLRLVAATVAAVVVVLVTSIVLPAEKTLATELTGPSVELTANASYRSQLLHEALTPGVIKPFGNTFTSLATARSQDTAVTRTVGSVDDEYIYLADRWGYVPLAALLVVVLCVGLTFWRRRGSRLVAIPAAALALFVGVYTVAFITQQQVFIWLLVGIAASLGARRLQGST
jgi:hypothetical protein